MTDFFRFPHTPHIAWLGKNTPRNDKVLSLDEAQTLLAQDVVLEEKLDGANLGFSVSPEGELQIQNRGHYLTPPYAGQFERLNSWLFIHQDQIFDALGEYLILFGEWCAARHSLSYENLPDWFLVFDVYDRQAKKFWGTSRRNALAIHLKLTTVPFLGQGRTSLKELESQVKSGTSQFHSGSLEGIIIRQESDNWLKTRAKLVHPDFTQAIDQHWRKRSIEWNHLASGF